MVSSIIIAMQFGSWICIILSYDAVIQGGVQNLLRGVVLRDLWDALLEKPVGHGIPAIWCKKEEQEELLNIAYNKWDKTGSVWSLAALKVCLALNYISMSFNLPGFVDA